VGTPDNERRRLDNRGGRAMRTIVILFDDCTWAQIDVDDELPAQAYVEIEAEMSGKIVVSWWVGGF